MVLNLCGLPWFGWFVLGCVWKQFLCCFCWLCLGLVLVSFGLDSVWSLWCVCSDLMCLVRAWDQFGFVCSVMDLVYLWSELGHASFGDVWLRLVVDSVWIGVDFVWLVDWVWNQFGLGMRGWALFWYVGLVLVLLGV